MQFAALPKRRKPSLTPMIDVVFLLLVFFMLASRFGQDMEIDLPLSAAADRPYQGAPRLVEVRPDTVSLNGVSTSLEDLLGQLGTMMLSYSDAIVVRPREAADLQRVIDVMGRLADAGYETLVLVE